MDHAENEHNGLHEAGLQCLQTNRENELKRQEEARKEDRESNCTEQQERKEPLKKIMEEDKSKEEQMEAQIIQETKKKEIQKLRHEVHNLKPGNSVEFPDGTIRFPEVLNVGLFGITGVGKSSLLNSLKYAFKGELTEFTREQTSTANFQGGNTVRRLEVKITRYLTFIDNRGVRAEDLETLNAAKEIIRQFEGRSSFAEKVDWGKEITSDVTHVDENKRIYCTVMVFDARNPQSVYTVLDKLVKQIFEWQGRYPIGVITHVDVATQDQLDNMYAAFKTAGLVDTYEVANITSDNENHETEELSLDHQLNLLRLMKRCIKEGDCIFTLRGRIERLEVQQAEEREREAEEERKKEAILEKEKEEARQAKEAKEARIYTIYIRVIIVLTVTIAVFGMLLVLK